MEELKEEVYNELKEIAENSHYTVYEDFVICNRKHYTKLIRLEQKEMNIKHNYDYIFEKATEEILKKIYEFIKIKS